jgi:type II secretory pathway pseudopilin PulG
MQQKMSPGGQFGFTYLALLVALLSLSLATQGVMTYVSQQVQREREADLLRVGQAFARAIGAYYESTPGSVKRWPQSLEDLVEDKRQVAIQRHLREVYPDPITRSRNWGLVIASGGGIQGVYSQSAEAPIRVGPVELDRLTLAAATRYAQWSFVYEPTSDILRAAAPGARSR